MHHGTLMFRSDLETLTHALNASESKIQSKGIKSIKSRVANISDYIEESMGIEEFKSFLVSYLSEMAALVPYTPVSYTHLAGDSPCGAGSRRKTN